MTRSPLRESLLSKGSSSARQPVCGILLACFIVVSIAVVGWLTSWAGGGQELAAPRLTSSPEVAMESESMTSSAGRVNGTEVLAIAQGAQAINAQDDLNTCLASEAPASSGATCGSRVGWFKVYQGLGSDDAFIQVSQQFPVECGCLISSLPRCQINAPKLGVGLHLQLQTHPLDLEFAVGKLANAGVRSVRMWDYNASYLEALDRASIKDVLVDVPDGELQEFAEPMSPDHPAHNLANILRTYHDQGMALRVGVGNEPLAELNDKHKLNSKYLPLALRNVISALSSKGLDDITVTVPFANTHLEVSYPPEQGAFKTALLPVMQEIAEIIYQNHGEFSIQPYSFFACQSAPQDVPLNLALGEEVNMVDGRQYNGLLSQMIAAHRAALVKIDGKYVTIPLSVTETGWPSAGDAIASVDNLCKYARNTIKAATSAIPLDPCFRTLYLFEAFDEGEKENGPWEPHFGLYTEDGEQKCDGLHF